MIFCVSIAWVASISVRFEARNEEPESKTARKMGQVKQQGGGGSFFTRPKHKNPVPRSFFTPKDRNQTETLATHSSVPIEIVNVIFTLWMDFSCMAIQSFEWSQGGWGYPLPFP